MRATGALVAEPDKYAWNPTPPGPLQAAEVESDAWTPATLPARRLAPHHALPGQHRRARPRHREPQVQHLARPRRRPPGRLTDATTVSTPFTDRATCRVVTRRPQVGPQPVVRGARPAEPSAPRRSPSPSAALSITRSADDLDVDLATRPRASARARPRRRKDASDPRHPPPRSSTPDPTSDHDPPDLGRTPPRYRPPEPVLRHHRRRRRRRRLGDGQDWRGLGSGPVVVRDRQGHGVGPRGRRRCATRSASVRCRLAVAEGPRRSWRSVPSGSADPEASTATASSVGAATNAADGPTFGGGGGGAPGMVALRLSAVIATGALVAEPDR